MSISGSSVFCTRQQCTRWHPRIYQIQASRLAAFAQRKAHTRTHATSPDVSTSNETPLRRFTPRQLRHVRFTVPHYVTAPGHALAIVGSWKELGAWDPSRAALLERMPDDAWCTDLFLPAEDGLEFKVVVVKVVEEETGSCVRWEGGQNRVLDLELSDQKQTPELLEVPCWWGVKPKGASPSDLDTAIIAAVGVKPLVGLLDSPSPHEVAAAAAALAKLCDGPSKKDWRREIAAAGALPGLQRVADSFKVKEVTRQHAARAASKVKDAARDLEKQQERQERRIRKEAEEERRRDKQAGV